MKKKFASIVHPLAQPGGRKLNSPMIQQWEMRSQTFKDLTLPNSAQDSKGAI